MKSVLMTIRKRPLFSSDIELIKKLILEEGHLGRTHISRRLCRIWEWRQENGNYKEITYRDLLRLLDSKGYIKLPPILHPARHKGYKNKTEISIVLVETFVDTERLKGTCYKAANWQFLGLTKGRGRNDRYKNSKKSVKAVFIRSLCKDFLELCNE
jgi:hypothetical protein